MSPNGNVLVVEDESVSALLIRHQLIKLGYSVAGVVGSGEEAVSLAQQNKPDLVLMDIGLSGSMDGVEAALAIRRTTGIPVVFLTASSDEETVERARAAEAYGYLHKPLKDREAHTTLQLALYKSEMETRLQEEHRWLATTLRCIADAVIATDATGAVKLLNPTAERLTGWREQAAIGRDLSDVFQLFEADTATPAECAVTRLLHDVGTTGIISKKLLLCRDGSQTLIEESASPITNESGHMSGVVLVFRPVPPATVQTRHEPVQEYQLI
jgi:two-component system, cell cycle sensor histidine kinase and response regulator CckA